MKYLLDTCIISELTKKNPNSNVINWMNSVDMNDIFISVLTLGEIIKGILRLKDQKKRDRLSHWFYSEVLAKFKNNIIDIDNEIAVKWGEIDAKSELSGRKIPVIDGLIAASAMVNNLTVVTRNTKDIEKSECRCLNHWEK